ncbi:sensor domain-containing diguanylate cyclase [Oxalobacteraceae bacterium R-40]|uniref:Sensor domain-containing diguanylate cyclase n=1 Tax=Keguizhuia sedimenti TaxID=3064264 RepID=A0ABU1BLX6_9BURK|nr:sensor domain-containing diguanylate cyclase [Oxalobacteraceae bacterium R-40]
MPLSRPVKHGARYRLTWLVMACVLPMLALITFIVIDQYRHDREQLIQKSVLTTRAMALTIDKDLGGVETGLHALANSQYLKTGNLRAFHQQAKEVLRHLDAGNIYLTDANGQQLIHTERPYGADLPVTGSLVTVRKVFASGDSAVSDLFIGAIVRRPLVAVVVPAKRGDKVAYALGATVYPERLSATLARQGLPPDWIAAIYDGGGHFITRNRDIDKLLGKRGSAGLREKMASTREGSLENRTIDGTPVIAIFSRSTRSDWTIAIGIPKAKLNAELWRRVALIAIVTFFILLGTLALAWNLGGKIARAIHALIGPALALGRNEQVIVQPSYLKETDEVGKAIERAADILAHTRHQAYHDPLTGLPNRTLFNEIIAQQLALCRRYGDSMAILYIDLDGFKSVNDTHGHAVGDLLLLQVAARLELEVRRSDLVSRLGGDEFATLLMNTDRSGAATVAEKLVEVLSAPYQIGSISLTHISASIGVAMYPEAGKDIETLLQRADYAMYLAKAAGKRHYAFAEAEIRPDVSDEVPEQDAAQLAHTDKSAY